MADETGDGRTPGGAEPTGERRGAPDAAGAEAGGAAEGGGAAGRPGSAAAGAEPRGAGRQRGAGAGQRRAEPARIPAVTPTPAPDDAVKAEPSRIPAPTGPPTTLSYRLRTIHLPLILIGLGLAVAMILVALDRWRRGTVLFGVVTLAAAAVRLVLAPERVGVLAVRSRAFDVTTLTAFGGLIIWLGLSIESLGTG